MPTFCNENSIYVFLFWEMHSLSRNFHFHVSVSDLYIPRINPHISCSRICRSIVGKYKSLTHTHECGNWDCGRAIPFLGIFVPNFRYWLFAVQGLITYLKAYHHHMLDIWLWSPFSLRLLVCARVWYSHHSLKE
jgi:hypothetical protein